MCTGVHIFSYTTGISPPSLFSAHVKDAWRSQTPLIGNLFFDPRVSQILLGSPRGLRQDGSEECCHAGGALLPFGLVWFCLRKPPNAPASCSAHRVPSFGFMLPNIRRPPPRCGHEATVPRRPRLKRRGVVSGARPPKLRRPRIGGRRGK